MAARPDATRGDAGGAVVARERGTSVDARTIARRGTVSQTSAGRIVAERGTEPLDRGVGLSRNDEGPVGRGAAALVEGDDITGRSSRIRRKISTAVLHGG